MKRRREYYLNKDAVERLLEEARPQVDWDWVAEIAEVNPDTVGRWRRREIRVRVNNLVRLARGLKVSMQDLSAEKIPARVLQEFSDPATQTVVFTVAIPVPPGQTPQVVEAEFRRHLLVMGNHATLESVAFGKPGG